MISQTMPGYARTKTPIPASRKKHYAAALAVGLVAFAPIALQTAAVPGITAAVRAEPVVPADSQGWPLKDCGPANDGERVETRDKDGNKFIHVCYYESSIIPWIDDEWRWLRIIWA